jgi:hypothetical protein
VWKNLQVQKRPVANRSSHIYNREVRQNGKGLLLPIALHHIAMTTVEAIFTRQPGNRCTKTAPSANFPFAGFHKLWQLPALLLFQSAPLSLAYHSRLAIGCQFIYNKDAVLSHKDTVIFSGSRSRGFLNTIGETVCN